MTEEEILAKAVRNVLGPDFSWPHGLTLNQFVIAVLRAKDEIEAAEVISDQKLRTRAHVWLLAAQEFHPPKTAAAKAALRAELDRRKASKVTSVFPRDRRSLMAWFDAHPPESL